MQKVLKKIWKKEHLYPALIFLVMILAFTVRFYNFHDWLYFKMDQARDSFVIGNAIENGPGYLPLLGARAGATEVDNGFLRLGPAFYYFQYISGKIFNSTVPDIFAYPDLFFSILAIPLLYFFLRFYFEKRNAFLIMLMYTFSFLVIEYSRFAWNPNSLSFFTLLSFCSLLKLLNTDNFKQKIGWAFVWALGISIGSQLHFLGLFCLPSISFLLILLHYKPWKKEEIIRIKSNFSFKKTAAICAVVIATALFIYSPVIISDVIRKGENSKNFVQAFGTKPGKKPFLEKISKSLKEQTKYYCIVATSECYKGKIEKNKTFGFLTAAVMLFGLALLARKIRKEKDAVKKDFLWLILVWFGVFFFLAIPLYASLRPRFFIPVFPIPFIFLGLIGLFFEEKMADKGKYAMLLIAVIILGLNIRGTSEWFKEQADSQKGSRTIDRTLILKNQDGVTLGQLEKAADFIYEKTKKGNNAHFYVKPEHVQPMRYLLSQKKDPNFKYFLLDKQIDSNGQYFAIYPSKNKDSFLEEKFGSNVEILSTREIGQIKIQEFKFLESLGREDFKFNSDQGISDRVFWKDVFGIDDSRGIQIDAVE